MVGHDERTDIAVLKIDAHKQLPFIQLGNSANVKPGEWVVAMGNPFGLGGSVTAGIVSASGRDIGAGPYDQFIQIDAPINQGNSGGPLFTQDGKVIGMNTAILSPSGGSIGIGFAIPSDMIHTVVAQLETTGKVTRGYIGVEAQQVNDTMAKAMHLNGMSGALIAGVQNDTPASRAGLEPGDVITAVNDQAVKNPRDLAVNIAAVQPGDEAKLQVLHDGDSKAVSVKVGQMPNEQVASNENAQPSRERIGLALAPLSPDLRSQLEVPGRHARGCGAQRRAGISGGSGGSAGRRRHRRRRWQEGVVTVRCGERDQRRQQGPRGRAAHHPQRRADLRRRESGPEFRRLMTRSSPAWQGRTLPLRKAGTPAPSKFGDRAAERSIQELVP